MSLIDQVLKKTIISELGCKTAKKIGGSPSHDVLNQCFIYQAGGEKLFIKVNAESLFPMYEGEASGLSSIRDTQTLRVPECRFLQRREGYSILALEYIELHPHTPQSQRELGVKLAKMHLCKGDERFGYFRDNTIGLTPQVNAWKGDWVDFFLEHRLEVQLKLLVKNHEDLETVAQVERFMKIFPSYFKGIQVVPSLLHGDLWGGNTGADSEGLPVIFDPAVYYGHHEAEFGILDLFGGFSEEFYKGYRSEIQEDAGFEKRLIGYKLYHALNHYHLFGSSYRPLCQSLLSKIN